MSKLKLIKSLLALCALSAVTAALLPDALAYIPSSQTIFARMVRNNGKGAYVIEQEVQFRTAAEPVTLRERWVIENGENMRLTVSSQKGSTDGTRFEAVYRDGRRVAPDLQGGLSSGALGQEFIEGFFHARSNRGFNMALLRARIVPGTFLRERPKPSNLKDMRYTPEPMVRLGRSAGVITWIIGDPSPVDSKKSNPEVWIEQDAFVLRRLRLPSEAEITADRYSNFGSVLRLPRERTIAWGSNSALIRVLSAKSIDANQAAKLIDLSSVNTASAKAAHLPDLSQIKEFYSRFR